MTARGLITTLTVTALGLSSSLGAATVRGHRVSGRHPHARFAGHSHGAHHGSFRRHAGYHGGYHHGFSHYGFYSPSYSYFPYGAPYGVFYGYPVYYADHVYETRVDESFVDTDVRPEDADVYLDGRYIGAADDYDGYPQYLRIEPGSHTITFTRRGRRTVTREFTAEAGELVSFDFRMQKGYGTAGPVGRVDSGGPAASRDRDEPVEIRPPPAEAPPSEDAGFARLDIRPADASVYIDGEFYGSAARVAGLHGDLRLSAGRHVIEVVRPGYRAVRRELQIRAGDEVRLSFGLQRIRPAR